MRDIEVLKDLFDEKLIEIINLFIERPTKQFYLSEVAKLAKVNVATTFRNLNRLVSQGILTIKVIGKIKLYQLNRNEKVDSLIKMLRKEEGSPIDEFVAQIKEHPRVRKIVLESREKNKAKVLLVGDFIPQEKVNKIIEKIKNEHNFKIDFVEISEKQFDGLNKMYNLNRKIIYEKREN